MSDNITKSPQIRFAEFTDAWEQHRLRDVTERVTRKNKDLESTLPLTISAQYGLVDQETFFKKVVASKDISGYYLLMNGEFAYNKSYSKDYPWGAVKRLDLYDTGVLSTLYITFKPMKVDSDFLVCYYDTNNWHKEVAMRAAEGARNHGLLNITATDFFDTELFLPKTNDEQQKIGSFFKQLDEPITLHQRKLELLKATKKSLLEKMFPKDGANVPEIRFAGFTDAWERRKYGEVIDLLSGQDFSPSEYNDTCNGIPYMTGASCIVGKETIVNRWTTVPRCLAEKGDVLLVCKGSGYGAIAVMAQDKAHIARQFMALKNLPNLDKVFNFYLLNSVIENIKKEARGLIAGIARDAVIKQEISIPSLAEQSQIGSLLKTLDDIIALHQRELNSLKNLKKSLLQQMFI